MTFEEVVDFIMKANQGENLVLEEDAAYYKDTHSTEYIVHIRRDQLLEQLLQKHYSTDDILYVYESNQYAEDEMDIDVFVRIEDAYYTLGIELDDLPNGKITVSTNILNHKHQSFTSSHPPVERNLLNQHFPKLGDLVISYIKELPKYRLHFATNDIEIEDNSWK